MTDDPVTFEYYEEYLRGLGVTDPFDIKQQYKLYLAVNTDDLMIITKALISYKYNAYYMAIGRLN